MGKEVLLGFLAADEPGANGRMLPCACLHFAFCVLHLDLATSMPVNLQGGATSIRGYCAVIVTVPVACDFTKSGSPL